MKINLKKYALFMIINLLYFQALGYPSWDPQFINRFSNPDVPINHKLRLASLPYITYDAFRSICDHVCDETDVLFDPKLIKYADLIYVNSRILEQFFKHAHPKIKNPYILISGNSDASAPGACANMLDDPKLLAWYGANCDLNYYHKKFIPIPIGIANKFWPYGDIKIINNLLSRLKQISKPRLLIMNFSLGTNYEVRHPIFVLLNNKQFFNPLLKPIYQLTQPFEEYILELTRSKFVISPHGHGLDCYRTWEALLVNTIPIVKTSSLDALYTDLPVMIVKNWSEVTKEFLEEQYSIIKNKSYKLEKLYFNYWHDLIKAHKQTCLCARKF